MSITISITPAQFAELVTPVLPFVDRQVAGLPALQCILIRSHGDYLTAVATDRYRVAINRVKPSEKPGADLYALLNWRDAQYITRMFKPVRGQKPGPMTLTFDGSRLTVTQGEALGQFMEASVSFATPGYDFPSLTSIWPTEDDLRTWEPAGHANYDPAFLADFKAAANGEPVRMIARKGKPTFFLAGEDLVGAVMTLKAGGEDDAVSDYAKWADILAEPTTRKVKKGAAA